VVSAQSMGFLQILSGTGALALVAIGLAMARFDELRTAYWLFWTAGIVATVSGLWWAHPTSGHIAAPH